ncbi:delta-60 repeat domain-containing protein [Nocardia terpenica]|uniref:delta-60 repeat domain-containing protein n=1 Tax=Nocardia terpenica TaxID=455432 RepID=UPI002FE04839
MAFAVTFAAALCSCSSSGSGSGSNDAATHPGTLDPKFGNSGTVNTDLGSLADRANAVALQSDRRIVVAGSTQDPAQGDNLAILRYTGDGKLDASFGTGGKVSTDFGGKSDIARAVSIQSDGRVVAVRTSHGTGTGDNIALARYTSNGTLDHSFGTDGKVSTDLGTQADHANAAAIQSDGRIIVAGTTKDPSQSDNIAVMRYHG